MSKTAETARREFNEIVNMTAAELDDWLARPESEEVVTARLLPRLTGHDALDHFGIAAIVSEESPDAAPPGSDVGEELLEALDVTAGEGGDAFVRAGFSASLGCVPEFQFQSSGPEPNTLVEAEGSWGDGGAGIPHKSPHILRQRPAPR